MEPKQTLTEGQEGAPAGSSPAETAAPVTSAPASEAVKSVTGREQGASEAVPYERFREVEAKAKLAGVYEDVLMEHFDKLQRDPATGKLRLNFDSGHQKESQPLEREALNQ